MNNENVFKKKEYQESASVKKAYDALNSHNANKPGAYNSKWQNNIDNTINKILNREKFSYDLNGDALYQQYKDQYTTQGKLAMMNTMGQAAAMTGGYGSSYSQAAGQQAYQGYLQQLNEVVPQLYQMAYDRYNQEGQDMYSQYSMLSAQDQADYGKYRDTVADFNAERDYLTGVYNSERDFDYSKYQSDTNFDYKQFLDDRNYNYQAEQDAILQQQWEKSFAADEEQRKIGNEQWEKSFAADEEQRKIGNEQWEKEYELKEQSHELDKMKFESEEEQRAWENLMVETEYNDSKKSEEQKNAENLALKWLSMGIMPESSVLEAAGISAESAESMVGAVNAEKNSSIESENRSYKYETAMEMLANGEMPSAELLAQAGISIEDATTRVNAYKAKEQDKIDAEEKAKQDKTDAENKAKNHDIAINLIAAGEEVPYEVQKLAGLSNTEISAFRKIYAAAGGATSDPTKVSDLTEMATNMIDFYDNYGPEVAAAIGMMYEQNGYVTHNELGIILSAIEGAKAEGNGAIDTSVEPIGKPNGEVVSDPEDEEEKKKNNSNGARAGGGAGKDAIRYTH